MVEKDIADGAPTIADGRSNLVRYAAWLVCSDEAGHAD